MEVEKDTILLLTELRFLLAFLHTDSCFQKLLDFVDPTEASGSRVRVVNFLQQNAKGVV